jgi:hypothetical protein
MRPLATCLSVVCAAVATVVVIAATSGAQQPGPPTGTLELVLRDAESRFRFVDNPPLRRESAGDMAVVAGRARGTDGAPRGRLQAYFVATKSANFERAFRGQVSGTFMLNDGDIVIGGVTDDRRREEPLAIAGGTGSYAGARGTVVVTETRRETRFRFTFMP